jgi:hypothetical protein
MTSISKKVLGSLGAIALSVLMVGASFADGPSVSGFVDFGYNYNLNKQTTNVLRTFDSDANTFTLQSAKITTSGTTKDNVSYRVDLMYGKDASVINYANPHPGQEYDFEQAFVSFPCPITNGTVTVGKFVTPFGAEVIEAKDDLNISRGFLFNYAIPLHHTGVKYDKALGPVNVTAGLVNGWDNIKDNNKGKTFIGQVGYQVTSKVKATLGGAYGPEQATAVPSVEKNGRALVDAIVTYAATDKLSLLANADWGVEEGLAAVDPQNVTQNWSGIAVAGSYAFSDKNSVALRYENFSDDGSRTALGTNLVLNSITATLQHKMNSVIYRLEFRADSSNKKVFTDSDGLVANSKNQSTVGAQVI